MIGVDTYTWKKLLLLYHSEWGSLIDNIIDQINFFVTSEGKIEFEYRFPEEIIILNRIAILPVLKGEIYRYYIEKGFDKTDASLLEYSEVRGYRIITEDHLMLSEAITKNQNIIQLIDFFRELCLVDAYFLRKEIYQIAKLFRKWKNITKKKEKQILMMGKF